MELFILQLFILESIYLWNLLWMLMHLIMFPLYISIFDMYITLYWYMHVYKK